MGRLAKSQARIDQKHLDLISRIYDLPLRPEGWQQVMDEFGPVMNAKLAGIAAYDPVYTDYKLNVVSTGLGPSLAGEFQDLLGSSKMSVFAQMALNPKRGFQSDLEMHDLDEIEQYAERPVVQWLKQNHNVFHGAASCLNLDRSWTDILFVMFADNRGPVSDQERKVGAFFLDHFAKTSELSRAFGVLRSRFNGVLTALDRFHIGIFVLSSSGSVVLKNAEAERLVEAGDGLSLSREGKLLPANEVQRAELKNAIGKAVDTAQAQDHCAETVLTFVRPSGKDSYLVEVSPFRDRDEIESRFKGSLVFVIDPTKTDVVSTRGMEALYSLTETESQVCQLVAKGFETDELAETRNISRETVRNYIKQILHKTGTKNRAQLVRLALNVNLPIDPAS